MQCDICRAPDRQCDWPRLRAYQEPYSRQTVQTLSNGMHASGTTVETYVNNHIMSEANKYAKNMQAERELGLRQHCDFCYVPHTPRPAEPSYPQRQVNTTRRYDDVAQRWLIDKFGDLRNKHNDVGKYLEDLNFESEQHSKISRACMREEFEDLKKCLGDHDMQEYALDGGADAIIRKIFTKGTTKDIVKEVTIDMAGKALKVTVDGAMSKECSLAIDAWNSNLCEKRILPRGRVKICTYPELKICRIED